MTAISKAWVTLTDAATDADSPVDQALVQGIRDSLVHVREWLGASFTAGAVQDHNHDGVNSALVEIGPNAIRNGSFESDGQGWNITTYTGGSSSFNTANDMDGAKCLALTSTSTANGGGVATSGEFRTCIGGEKIAMKLAYKASVANVSSRARVIWYSDAQAQISTSDIYSTTSTPTTQTVATTVLTAPSTARFYKVELVGGVPGSGSATGTVYFDGFKGEFSPAGGDTCTYTGSLVESAAMHLGGGSTTDQHSVAATVDLGSNRVLTGIRITASTTPGACNSPPGLPTYMYLRGYNIKNN